MNLYSNQNAGDAAALEVTVSQIRKAFPQARLFLSMTHTSYGPAQHETVEVLTSFLAIARPLGQESEPRWRLAMMAITLADSLLGAFWFRLVGRPHTSVVSSARRLLRAYMEADLVINCAGMNFYTMGRIGLPFLVSVYTAAYALVLGKPLYVISQSIGPLHRFWERQLMRWLLSKAALVFVRDTISFQLLHQMGLAGPRYRLFPDIVFAFEPAPLEEGLRVLRRYGVDPKRDGPLLGWTVINRFVRWITKEDWEDYQRTLARVIPRFIKKHGGKVIFFAQTTGPTAREDDRETARLIIRQMQGKGEGIIFVGERLPATVLKSAYGLMDMFLATRMHAGIFAMGAGVPSLIIGYHSKAKGIMDMLGLDEWVLGIDSLEEELLWGRLEALWENRGSIRRYLRHTIPNSAEQVDRLGEIIAEDFYGRCGRHLGRCSSTLREC